jgi:hypothetical protein
MRADFAKRSAFVLLVSSLMLGSSASVAQPADDLSRDVLKLVELGEKAPSDLTDSILRRIESDPNAAYELLVPKLRDSGIPDTALLVYVWAIAHTGNVGAADAIINAAKARGDKSSKLKAAYAQALAELGGPKAGAFVLAQLDGTPEAETRFELFNVLGQIQYEPALPQTIEVLKVDPRELYWQPIFVFGKMGDVGVPFLIKQIDAEERNVRFNAIVVLGQWLMVPEASKPLQERFWKEDDVEIRQVILASLERTMTDLDAMAQFSREVVAKEKDESVRRFAQETLDCMEKERAGLESFSTSKKVDKAKFEAEYTSLFKSSGKSGSIFQLSDASERADELRLKKLRERILRRNSDEAFYDYQKVNGIILNNRRARSAAATRPDDSPKRP